MNAMKLFLSLLCFFVLPPTNASIIFTPELRMIIRQAELVIEGTVETSSTVRVEKVLRGEIAGKTVKIPDLVDFSQKVKEFYSLPAEELRWFVDLKQEYIGRFKKHGLIGSKVLLLLRKSEYADHYDLCGISSLYSASYNLSVPGPSTNSGDY